MHENGKGEDPCASGAPVEACASCASLTEVEWNHLRTVFAERSAKRANKSVPADTPAPVGPAPDSEEDPEASEIDDSILDLNQDEQLAGTGYITAAGISAPFSLSPLQPVTSTGDQSFSLPAISIPRSMAFPTGLTITPTTTSSAVFFKTPAPVATTAPIQTSTQTASFSTALTPQRLVPPPTPRTQMLKPHFEQQNMEMMHSLSQQNPKQIQDLSSQLQSGLQQLLSTSMEQMFQRLPSTPQAPPTASATQLSQPPQAQSQMVVEPPQLSQPLFCSQSTTPPVTKAQEPMDTSAPHGVPTIQKGLKGIKGSAPIAASTIQAVVAPPPAPIQPQVLSPLQSLEKGEYGADGSSYTSMSQPEDSEPENLPPPPVPA